MNLTLEWANKDSMIKKMSRDIKIYFNSSNSLSLDGFDLQLILDAGSKAKYGRSIKKKSSFTYSLHAIHSASNAFR